MKTTDDNRFSREELEILAQAYLDCRLSRLEEKELELVLSRCRLSSPLLDEARRDMRLHTAMASAGAPGAVTARRNNLRFPKWAVAAACLMLILAAGICYHINDSGNSESYACVIINGKRLPEKEADEYADKAKAESMAEFRRILENAERTDKECIDRINSLKNKL